MNGNARPLTRRVRKDAEIRTTRDGKPWVSFAVEVDAKADGEAPATRVRLFGDTEAYQGRRGLLREAG